MPITKETFESKALEEQMKNMFQQAYEQGVSDAIAKYNLPHHLRKQHIADLFQVKLATVENIIRMEGFPKSKIVAARYPRDLVIEWMNDSKNIEVIRYYQSKAI